MIPFRCLPYIVCCDFPGSCIAWLQQSRCPLCSTSCVLVLWVLYPALVGGG